MSPRGGKRAGAGRPTVLELMSKQVMVRFRPSELAKIEAARGRTRRAAWIRALVLATLSAILLFVKGE